MLRAVLRQWVWRFRAASSVLAALAMGCGQPPQDLPLTALPPPVAEVGHELSVPLLFLGAATAPEGSGAAPVVVWSWRSLNNPELSTRPRRPTLSPYTLGRAVWRWTPLADDAGPQEIEFVAQVGEKLGRVTLPFEVKSGTSLPAFREPFGEGTTLDLRQMECATISVVVESTASPRVDLSLVEGPETARLAQTTDLSGELIFCPDPKQVAMETVYPMILQAEAPPHRIRKSYVIVLRGAK